MLRLTGTQPRRWVLGTILASLALALLDGLGVAAMIPLTQLLSGVGTDSGVLPVISGLLGTDSPSVLIPAIAGGMAVAFILKSIVTLAFRWWLLGRTSKVSALAASELLRRYLLSPYAVHRTRRLSDVYWAINDTTTLAGSVLFSMLTLVTNAIFLVGIVVVLAIASPLVTLFVALLFAGAVFGIQRSLRGLQTRIGEEVARTSRTAWQFLLPGLDGFREARLSSRARIFTEGYERAKLQLAHRGRQLAIIGELPRFALEVAFVIAIGGISLVLFSTVGPAEALAVLGVFSAAALRGLPTLNVLANSFAAIRSGRIGMRDLGVALDELEASPSHQEVPRGDVTYEGDLRIEHVSFRYPDSDQLILNDVSLTIPRNRTFALVGSSGAGKSTLLDLVLGLLEPTQGDILCGSESIQADRAAWYGGLGVVPQEVFLLNDTLARNIAFGLAPDEIDLDRVREVLAMARLTDFVAELPDGIETEVGERGVRISGGQRQRIGIARALYRRPSLLVLDEATSALDNLTERDITETLARLKGSLTIVIVAHRLSTVRHADDLVFLKDGRVDARGTFDELRAANADFARLVELGELS
ncbi:ABC transporter ATP-binding protein [Microbacterium rhizophilus]|uniref:ABC transporter ATP-binding protein n=1 Tax=Microbacterium rhizophilus TaxID=3138934 RepID=UPI0031EAE11D